MHNAKTPSTRLSSVAKMMVSLLLVSMIACTGTSQVARDASPTLKVSLEEYEFTPIDKSEEAWKGELSEQAFYVLREKGTERAFTGEYWNHKAHGVYTCAGCDLPLFDSDTKFKSGTGWPSFYAPKYANTISSEEDHSLGMTRVEVLCGRCDGHLGHVFSDGPAPTGLRYCINSVSLNFKESKDTQ